MGLSENWKKIVIGGLIVLSVIIILIGLLLGLQGLAQFFKFIIISLLVISLLFACAWVFWSIFIKKEFKDIPAQFKKKLHSVTKVMHNDMLGDLYLSGDTKHNRIKMGKFFYMRINLPKLVVDEQLPVKEGQPEQQQQQQQNNSANKASKTEPVPVDCFIVSREGFINKIFSDPIFILVKPEDHDYSAIFNDVTINAFNLVPLDSQFFTIDRRNLDLDMVKGLALNYIRECVYDIFSDLDKLVKQAMNLDHEFQKDKEKAREFEIPQIGGFGGGGGGKN